MNASYFFFFLFKLHTHATTRHLPTKEHFLKQGKWNHGIIASSSVVQHHHRATHQAPHPHGLFLYPYGAYCSQPIT
ncbi:hypothetical protein F5X96DRAFT_646363 [Biscogniauxia mediterranea]|nr:hypothetical protein F5X96DRAFT_646363 [Biscogniauxia mediterranea]